VESSPQKMVDEKYAQKFLQFKDSVEVEYSANYLDSNSLVSVLRDPSGLYFVHYAIEPKRLSVDSYNDKYFANIKVNGTVSSLEGKQVFQFDRSFALNLDAAQMREASRIPFDYHDMFPLVPGTYKLSVLLKNDVSKEFTSLEQTLVIPGAAPALQMTAPILGYKTARADAARKRLKPFQLGGTQVYSQPGRVFNKKDTLAVVFQIFGLTPAQMSSAAVRYVLGRPGQPPVEKTRPLAEYTDGPNICEAFPLTDFVPAHYTLRVTVTAGGRDLISASDEFDVSHQQDLPRPWFYSRLMPEAADPAFDQILGSQLFSLGRMPEARVYLERAYQRKPDSADAALSLSQVYMAMGDAARIPLILTPFLAATQPPKYEVFVLAGQAYGKLGEFAKAVNILDQAVARFGVNTFLLNEIGENYIRRGQVKEALAALDKSLQLNPQQPEIKKKVADLREKK
jgi:predicted Zn-dependent protease